MNPPEALVERYRTRAPRYTSYPTAPQFRPLPAGRVEAALAAVRGPVSLYVHIPFCRHLCLYCGCHVEIKETRSIGTAYVQGLLAELDLALRHAPAGLRLDQLALGGGTPTFLLPEDMQTLIAGIRERLPFTDAIDASIEIDPRTVDPAYLERLVDLGFNRFSFGVQDFDEEVLAAVARPQSRGQVAEAVETLRRRGDFNLNLDLMYGLPGQDEVRFGRTLQALVALRPTRVALFHYAHVPWMKPAQKVLEKRGLPDSATKARLFGLADAAMGEAGYRVIGMDHYALPGDELVKAAEDGTLQRNFMGYTTRGGLDQLGIGVSAIASFAGIYAQDLKGRPEWAARIEAGELPVERGFVLSGEDRERRRLIMQLFCNFAATIPVEMEEERERLRPMEADGLLRWEGARLTLTPLGRHFVRNVCAVFDRYLEEAGERRYSMTA